MNLAKKQMFATALVASFAVGCGGDDAAGKGMSVSGGVDPVAQQSKANQDVSANKADPNFDKMASPDKRNTSRDKGVSSGGGTSSAILD